MAVIAILFDPRWLGEGPLGVVLSWQGIAAAATVMMGLLAAAFGALRYRPARALEVPADAPPLRLDDLLFIAVAVVPGAVIGGRLVHGLDHLDVYGRDPWVLLDPARGSLSLLGAVVGGTLTAAYIARVLEGGRPDWRRWLEVAAPILLLLVAGAKLSQFLGGGGQGLDQTSRSPGEAGGGAGGSKSFIVKAEPSSPAGPLRSVALCRRCRKAL